MSYFLIADLTTTDTTYPVCLDLRSKCCDITNNSLVSLPGATCTFDV